jgi:hypothetical protein
MARGSETFGVLAQYGKDMGGLTVQALDTKALINGKSAADRQREIAEAQEKTAKAAGQTTEELTDAQLATAGASKNLQSLGFSLATYAVPAVNKFATALEEATGFMNKKFGIGGTKSTPAGMDRGAAGGGPGGATVVGSADARSKAEAYYGKKISDNEFSALIKATHAEAGAGKQASQQEQAMIMASVLNRARTDAGGIMGALTAKNQFQSVTGTAADGHRPSKNYLQGPDKDRLNSIEGATAYLDKISKEQKNFTAASAAAYGPGTNIGYRDKMLAAGGQIIGGSVFQTGMPDGPPVSGPANKYQSNLSGVSYNSAGAGTPAPGQQSATEQQSSSFFASLDKRLAENNALLRQGNGQRQKILQEGRS